MSSVTRKNKDQGVPEITGSVRRIDHKYLIDSVLAAFYLEKGLLFTIKRLLVRPGKGVREFLFTDQRSRYTKPLGFLILSSSVAAIIAFSFNDSSEMINQGFKEGIGEKNQTEETVAEEGSSEEKSREKEDTQKVIKKFETFIAYYTQNFNLFLILYVPFTAFFCFLLFRKDRWYFTEHLVSNAYLTSIQNVISIPFFLIANIYPLVIYGYLILMILYFGFFYNRVYTSGKGFKGMLRILSVMILSTIAYSIFFSILISILVVGAIG